MEVPTPDDYDGGARSGRVEKLSWGQLLYLAGDNAEALGINGTGSPLFVSVGHPPFS